MPNSHRLGFTPTRLAVLRFIADPDAFPSVPVRPQHYTVAVRALQAAGLVRVSTETGTALVLTEDGAKALAEQAAEQAAPSQDDLVTRANEIMREMDGAMAAMDHERVNALQADYMEIFNQIDDPTYAPLPAPARPAAVVTTVPMCSAACPGDYLERTGGKHMPGCDQAEAPATLTAEEIADRVRANLVAFGGRQGFLADPGGWLDHVLADQPHTAAVDEAAKQAIDLIVADHEESKVPETAEEMVTELRDEWGIVDAYVMDPGPGTVHIPTADGSVFLSDREGSHPDPARPLGHFIGRRFDDGRDEEALWEDPQARSTSGALGQLAAEANKVSGRVVELTDLLDGNTATVTADQVVATIRGWYQPGENAVDDTALGQMLGDMIDKWDEFQAALLANDQVAAADIAGEIAVGFDVAAPTVDAEQARLERRSLVAERTRLVARIAEIDEQLALF